MTTDDYITTTGERWTVDNDGAMCLADKSGVAAYLIDDQRIYAELRALRAQRDELLAALVNAQGWLRTAAPVQAEQDITKAIAKAKGEACPAS